MSQIDPKELASRLSIPADSVEPYGNGVGKINIDVINKDRSTDRGKLIVVTAMTPTSHGEGKTVTSIGLAMALTEKGHRAVVCLRQPSLGPVFGLKGGAAGGGRAVVEPFHSINLGFTGDIFAIGASHNLLSAIIDNHLFHGNSLDIDTKTISWPRTIDMDDRALRHVAVGLSGPKEEVPRNDGFVITAASEVMAILGLSKDYPDLKSRLGHIVVGFKRNGTPVTANDLEATGAMASLLSKALRPNIVATSDNTPAFVHGGPFANIAHGTASLVSILMGLQHADYCVVETGFASDLGYEKFEDIVAGVGGFATSVGVIVATIRALKYHGGASAYPASATSPAFVEMGLENLEKHIENVRAAGAQPVICLNSFPDDSPEEVKVVRDFAETHGVPLAMSTAFRDGGKGAFELAERVVEEAAKGTRSHPIYSKDLSLEKKVEAIVHTVYGGSGVEWSEEGLAGLEEAKALGMSKAPVCIAKTHLSLSDKPALIGRPRDFTVTVRSVHSSVGAGFVVVRMGTIVVMPGLPVRPAAADINLTDDGQITGLH
jgi:formate--tetrahydrofolate ligase